IRWVWLTPLPNPPPQGGRGRSCARREITFLLHRRRRPRSIIEPDLVHQRRGRLAVGDDLGDRRRIGGELAVARNGRVDGGSWADRIFVVGICVDVLRLIAGEPLDQLEAVSLV